MYMPGKRLPLSIIGTNGKILAAFVSQLISRLNGGDRGVGFVECLFVFVLGVRLFTVEFDDVCVDDYFFDGVMVTGVV